MGSGCPTADTPGSTSVRGISRSASSTNSVLEVANRARPWAGLALADRSRVGIGQGHQPTADRLLGEPLADLRHDALAPIGLLTALPGQLEHLGLGVAGAVLGRALHRPHPPADGA